MESHGFQWFHMIFVVRIGIFGVQDGLQLLVRGLPTDPPWNLLQGPRRGDRSVRSMRSVDQSSKVLSLPSNLEKE